MKRESNWYTTVPHAEKKNLNHVSLVPYHLTDSQFLFYSNSPGSYSTIQDKTILSHSQTQTPSKEEKEGLIPEIQQHDLIGWFDNYTCTEQQQLANAVRMYYRQIPPSLFGEVSGFKTTFIIALTTADG